MTVKTAISLPDEVSREFDRLARKYGMSRSEFHRRGGLLLAARLRRTELADQGRVALESFGVDEEAASHLAAVADVVLDDAEAW